MPKFSIIVPVYNTSKFLPKCFDSILAQSLNDYEVIIISKVLFIIPSLNANKLKI